MAHEVQFKVPARRLGKSDVIFVVKGEQGVLGTLKVSKGAVVWYPKKTSYGYKADWDRFHKVAQDHFAQTEYRSKP
jgi:hypothetical protein